MVVSSLETASLNVVVNTRKSEHHRKADRCEKNESPYIGEDAKKTVLAASGCVTGGCE